MAQRPHWGRLQARYVGRATWVYVASVKQSDLFVSGGLLMAVRHEAALNDALMRVNWATVEDELVCRLSSTENYSLWKLAAGWCILWRIRPFGGERFRGELGSECWAAAARKGESKDVDADALAATDS